MKAPRYTANLSSAAEGDWRHQAKCRDLPAAVIERLFFPIQGRSGNAGRRFCLDCPVRQACEDEAMAARLFHSWDGIWGGRTVADRQKLRRGIDVPLPEPETAPLPLAKARGCDAGEPSQEALNKRRQLDRTRKRLAAGDPTLPHGSYLVVRAGCDCGTCSTARQLENDRRRQRHRKPKAA